jgi:hypothetical protein
LEEAPGSSGYACTPKGALTFARTGGGGVHYSYLPGLNEDTSREPIVMTMPAMWPPNYVVAEGFEEFLGIGFYVGWFAIEQVIYEPDWAAEYFAKEDLDQHEDVRARLAMLRKAMKVKHVPLSAKRVAHLTEKYSARLASLSATR